MSEDDLIRKLTVNLDDVHWPEPAQIRASARRRTLRTVVAVPLVLVLVLALAFLGLGHDRRSGPTEVHPTPTPTPSTLVGPSGPNSVATASGHDIVSTGDPGWFSQEALLQASDAGAGYATENETVGQPGRATTWPFGLDDCTAYGALHIVAFQRFRFERAHIVAIEHAGSTDGTVFAQVDRYSTADAKQVVADAQRAVQACRRYTTSSEASSAEHPAHSLVEWSVAGSDLAGDQSVLLRQRIVTVAEQPGLHERAPMETLYAVVRVGDLVTILQEPTDVLTTVSSTLLKTLGPKAATRLCAVPGERC